MSFRRDSIHFRVNASEFHNIKTLAEIRELTVSELVRRHMLGAVRKAQERDEMIASMYPQKAKNFDRWM